jgi:hypothetical protein
MPKQCPILRAGAIAHYGTKVLNLWEAMQLGECNEIHCAMWDFKHQKCGVGHFMRLDD